MQKLKMKSMTLTVILIALVVGQTMSAMSIFANAYVGTPVGTDLGDGVVYDGKDTIYVEDMSMWLTRNDNKFSVDIQATSKIGVRSFTSFSLFVFRPSANINNDANSRYQQVIATDINSTGSTSKLKSSTVFDAEGYYGIWTIKWYCMVRYSTTGFATETRTYTMNIASPPDVLPPTISLSKTDGNEVLPANVAFTISDQTNVDTYSYKVIRNSDSAIVVPETLVDIVDAKTYSGNIPNLDIANLGVGTFTAYVKAKDTLGYESVWSSIGFTILGDDDVNAPSITFNFNTPTMITGSAWQDCVPNKYIEWLVSDPSGLYSVAVYPVINGIRGELFSTSAIGNKDNGLGYLIDNIGTYALYIEATDNDFDNANPLDRSSGSATSPTKNIVDDDTSGCNIRITDLSFLTEGEATIVWEMDDTDGGAAWFWSTSGISGVDGYSITIYKDGEVYGTPLVHNSGTINYLIEAGTIDVNGLGSYQVHIEATNGDNDRGVSDADTTIYDMYFTLVDEDTTPPNVNINIIDLTILGAEVIVNMYDTQSGIASWSIEITHNGLPYILESYPESETDGIVYLPIFKSYTITEVGSYHIKVIATDGDIDREEGDQLTTTKEQDFYVHDYTPPQIAFEGDFDQYDSNPQIINVKVTDEETGLSSVIILFGFDLDLLDELGIEIDLNDIIMELIGLDIDIDLLDPSMIWIPIRITSDTIVEDIFNYLIDAFLGDIIGDAGSDLILGLLEDLFGMSLEELLGDSWDLVIEYLGEYMTEIFDWIDVQFTDLITIVLNAIHDLIIGLLLDEDFVEGQKTYEFSLDMKYFAWARLFGSFQFFVIASNTETILPIFTTSLAFSNKFTLSDDDTSLDIADLSISGDEDNIIIQLTDIDASGITILGLTIDGVPILPCFYTTTKVGTSYTLSIPKLWLVPLFGEDFHTATLYIIDNDNDWIIPYLVDPSFGTFDLQFELIDPEISYVYTGNGLDTNTGQVIFSVYDDSDYTITSGQLVNDVQNILDVPQTFTITAIDEFGNSVTLSVTITIRLDILAHLELLKEMCLDCNCWTKKNYQSTMIQKIDECIALYNAGEYAECYDKLLHDIKPKLTGLKMDEDGNTYGNADFKNAWVSDEECQNNFNIEINKILHALNILF